MGKIECIKYPKIKDLKSVRYEIVRKASFKGLDENDEPIYGDPGRLPTLGFLGTVKLHGTNAAIRIHEGKRIYQSRNNVITAEKDNAGFVAWCEDRFIKISEDHPEDVIIYGEFCGGNIQSKVGIRELSKMFVTFDRHDIVGEDVYCIKDFPTYEITIDFNNLEATQNKIIELTAQVEKECPVAKHFGVSGIGEGIVWKCVTPGYEDIMFKVKGEKHSKSKVKTLKPVDLEKLNKVQALAIEIMTPRRCEQGLEYLEEMQLPVLKSSTGAYLKYVVSDAIEEEKHTIEEAGLKCKEMGKYLSQIAKDWYFQRV